MTNEITINSIKSNYDGNNVTRRVEFSLGGGNIWLGITDKEGVWSDNDGKPGLSEGDTVTIGDENVPWNDPRATEMAVKAEEEYKTYLEWRACVEKKNGGSGVRNDGSTVLRIVNEYKCDKKGGFLPELEFSQYVSPPECKLPGEVMLTLKNNKLISLVRSGGLRSWLFEHACISVGPNMPGSVYDPFQFGVQSKNPKIIEIEIKGESHPDLKGLESLARGISDNYTQKGKEACKERHDICARLWGTEDFTERLNILRENGGFDLFDQCVEMK